MKSITLVGELNNTEFKNFIRKTGYSLETDFFPREYLPTVQTKKEVIWPEEGDTDFKDSGFSIITTVYVF